MKVNPEDRNWRKDVSCLQDVSSEAEETSEGSTGESHGLVAGVGLNWGGGWLAGWDSGGSDLSGDGGIWVDWNVGWWWCNYARGGNWLDNGAWAVGDGQGGGLSDSVGLLAVDHSGWVWAVGGVRSDDLSGVDWGGAIVVSTSRGGSNESCEGDDGVLHLDGWY